MRRTELIEKAMREAKKRDGYKCRICGRGCETGHMVVGAHLLPRNSPQPNFCAFDQAHIITMCWNHHTEYDKNKTGIARARWLWLKGLWRAAGLVLWFYGQELPTNISQVEKLCG